MTKQISGNTTHTRDAALLNQQSTPVQKKSRFFSKIGKALFNPAKKLGGTPRALLDTPAQTSGLGIEYITLRDEETSTVSSLWSPEEQQRPSKLDTPVTNLWGGNRPSIYDLFEPSTAFIKPSDEATSTVSLLSPEEQHVEWDKAFIKLRDEATSDEEISTDNSASPAELSPQGQRQKNVSAIIKEVNKTIKSANSLINYKSEKQSAIRNAHSTIQTIKKLQDSLKKSKSKITALSNNSNSLSTTTINRQIQDISQEIEKYQNTLSCKLDHFQLREALTQKKHVTHKIYADGFCGHRSALALSLVALRIQKKNNGSVKIADLGSVRLNNAIHEIVNNESPILDENGKLQESLESFVAIEQGLIDFNPASHDNPSGEYLKPEQIEKIFQHVTRQSEQNSIEPPRLIKMDDIAENGTQSQNFQPVEGPLNPQQYLVGENVAADKAASNPFSDQTKPFDLAVTFLDTKNRHDTTTGKNAYANNHFEISVSNQYAELLLGQPDTLAS